MISKKLFLVWVIVVFSCEKEPSKTIVHFDNPGSSLGSEPNLHAAEDGTIYLSWIEAKKNEKSKLLFSTLNENDLKWSESKLIAEGADWFVNWADFPSITSFGENNLAAHYLDKSADDTYAYDIKLVLSNDNGKTWDKTKIPHTDGTNTEHGFVSKLALKDGNLLSVWLDGRQFAYAEKDSAIAKEMTLRSAVLSKNGELLKEFELDQRVCDCCQTDAAMTEEGPIVVYRDRSDKEIRDIYYVRYINGSWTTPKPIHKDNWSIFGCPVNGPAISALNNSLAVVWFTVADEKPKVKVAFSDDNGNTFSVPILVDQVSPSGRVDIELLKDNSAIISWMDTVENKTVILMQRVYKNGDKSEAIVVSESSENRSSGFPRMVLKDDVAYLAWTNSADTLTVKTALIRTDNLQKMRTK